MPSNARLLTAPAIGATVADGSAAASSAIGTLISGLIQILLGDLEPQRVAEMPDNGAALVTHAAFVGLLALQLLGRQAVGSAVFHKYRSSLDKRELGFRRLAFTSQPTDPIEIAQARAAVVLAAGDYLVNCAVANHQLIMIVFCYYPLFIIPS